MLAQRMSVALRVGLAASIIVCGATSASAQNKEVDAVTQAALDLGARVEAARKSIRTAHARLVIDQLGGRDVRTWTLWADGPRMRIETAHSQFELPSKAALDGEFVFTRNYGIRGDGDDFVIGSAEVHGADYNGTMLFDVRRLGLLPVPLGAWHSIPESRSLLNDPNQLHSTLEDVERDGQRLTLITRHGNDRVARMWIDEQRGPSVVRMEHAVTVGTEEILDTLTVQVAEIGRHWFPVEVTYSRSVDGIPLGPTERTQLKDIRLDAPLEPELFTLASFDVQRGEQVLVTPTPTNGNPIWDGTKLVSANEPAEKLLPVRRQLQFWLVVANLAIAAVCVIAYWRARSQQSKPPIDDGQHNPG